jgi:Family of unknown function (DUF6455)
MQNRSVLKRHAQLVDRMASALGLDLEEAGMRGDLPASEVTDAVLRCTGCTDPDACERWLDDHPQGAAATPGHCRNSDLFRQLKGGAG